MAEEMGLKEYARKRDFTKTPEPGPAEPKHKPGTRGGFFCVQRHDATRLHYDFRLEVEGVLVSWAVPKGPSLDPKRKALAMKVEDHPLDYGTFEGNIPKGEYGGGSVMLWDKGTYEVLGEEGAPEQLERGDFKFDLHGTKLNGSFAIVHMKHAGKGNEWLLIKKQDEFAVPGYDVDEFAWSVATHRTQQEIAENISVLTAKDLKGAKRAALPDMIEPMLATAVTKPPAGGEWVYEIKWDGVRALCRIDHGKLRIYSRRGNEVAKQYPELRALPSAIAAKTAWIDGEICVMDEEGRTRFNMIQPRIGANPTAVPKLAETSPVTLFLFDLLYLDGYDLRGAALEDRRKLLENVFTPAEHLQLSKTFDAGGEQMFEAARQMNLEGILAKDRHSPYAGTRSRKWLKIKVLNEQEFLIAGYMEGERDYFGSLILGLYEDGELRHVGQVGTGFDGKLMKTLFGKMQPLVTKTSPFKNKPKLKGATWLKPELVCEIRFLERTPEGMLRAPVFVGLRDDKVPSEVKAEIPEEPPDDLPSDDGNRLDFSGKEKTLDIDGQRLKFTNLDKLFFPKDGYTKRDVLEFYDRVSPFLLPHLKDRPLSLKRYPNGIHSDYFFQKNASTHFPDWLRCFPIQEHQPPKINHYPLADNKASLLYLVNLGCIDQNPWMSRVTHLENPDWMLLDLDPVDASFDLLVDAALLVRELLEGIGLRGYPKTTGGDGMHVYVPLEPIYSYDQVRSLAEVLTHLALDREPNLFTTPRSVNKRQKGRVYFDYLQIGRGKTIAAPYVVRAYDGAAVATPLEWREVKRGLRPTDFTIRNAPERFEKKGDLFAPVLDGGQRIETALERLAEGSTPEEKPKARKTAAKRKVKASQ
jgi:bifunctional non-homologous end joining protein LigD